MIFEMFVFEISDSCTIYLSFLSYLQNYDLHCSSSNMRYVRPFSPNLKCREEGTGVEKSLKIPSPVRAKTDKGKAKISAV